MFARSVPSFTISVLAFEFRRQPFEARHESARTRRDGRGSDASPASCSGTTSGSMSREVRSFEIRDDDGRADRFFSVDDRTPVPDPASS